MNHWIIAPVVLPLMCGATLVLIGGRAPALAARISGVATAALLAVAIALLVQADRGGVQAYLVGNWAAPFGISLVLDRLSALMLTLTAGVALAALLYARGGDDRRGPHFHALFQFQLMGLNGAFLTADLFNLFVFFEVLLISSYGLLLHGAGLARLRASLHYVGFNLAGAALFLIAVSLLYGLTGTLNMADMAQRMAHLPADRGLLLQSAALLLLVVFFVKAALLPLYFWLPATYGAACAPAAALFAVMTKVGVYSVLRVSTLIFGEDGGPTAGVAGPWLPALALATIALAAIGALAAQQLRTQIGYLVIGSAGTLLLAVGLAQPATVAAGLFYMVNSTLVAATLFLLVDRIAYARGQSADTLRAGPFDGSRHRLGVTFLVCAVAAAGMPPLAGFMGKALLLQAAGPTVWGAWTIAAVLAGSLLVMVALARSGSVLFWSPAPATPAQASSPIETGALPPHAGHGLALVLLLAAMLACSLAAGPLSRYTQATAAQLFERQAYLRAVLGAQPVPAANDVRREMRERGGKP
ncbi:MAG: monovalent cation/H+ antiporter subunit D [Hydrogenophaga sp.]|uniref:monovalent cation/H+ antiporter subunit D n=1 Tax=unclassified Hydrogenophaga TaxID=2610897 RepID=UPI0010F68268|nr:MULTISPECIES: monovalent cation/H+ antiporter subunit D [unclassified Hydrogenophaga]MDZ4103891.1 monovalent cation/H+ antiporter subunit D [Hydrogenophaga sp.]